MPTNNTPEQHGKMKDLLKSTKLILMEATIVERIRRAVGVKLHKTLLNAPLIYTESGRTALRKIAGLEEEQKSKIPWLWVSVGAVVLGGAALLLSGGDEKTGTSELPDPNWPPTGN